MTTDAEALRRAFEGYVNPDADIDLRWLAAGYYAGRNLQMSWLDFQAGHAAAKAETAAAVAKERERASVLYDMLLNRPALNAGLESEYAAWTSKCYQVTGAYKAAIRAGAKSDG